MSSPLPRLTRYLAGSAFAAVALVAAAALVALPSASAQTADDEFFTGDIPEEGGAALLTVAGGTVDELGQAAEAQGFETVWLTVDGQWIAYSTTAPDFVNDRLREAFPDGIPEGTSVLVNVPQGGGTSGTPTPTPGAGDTSSSFTAEIGPLNDGDEVETASGTATFSVEGDTFTVTVDASGLAPDVAHAQHIHLMGACPTMDADGNDDGFVDLAEGLPSYGDVMLPLDDDLSNADADTYPTADAEGNLTYEQTASISELETLLGESVDLGSRSYVIHGVGTDVTLPSGLDAATLPVGCGAIEADEDTGTPTGTPTATPTAAP